MKTLLSFFKKNRKETLIKGVAILVLVLSVTTIAFKLAFKTITLSSNSQEVLLIERKNQPLVASVSLSNSSGATQPLISSIISQLDKAQETVDIAMFSLNSPELYSKLSRINKKGVRVRLIIDKNRIHLLKNLEKNYGPLKVVSNHSGNMHHKFAIIDANTDQAQLLTGSTNWTNTQLERDDCSLLHTSDPSLIKLYHQRFERLLNSFEKGESAKELVEKKLKANKIQYDDSWVELWFSPKNNKLSFRKRLLSLLNNANSEIIIGQWLINDHAIKEILFDKLKQGLAIKLVIDDYNIWRDNSIFKDLLIRKELNPNLNLSIATDLFRQINNLGKDSSFNYFFHQHYSLIDKKILIVGTTNLTDSAYFFNYEDVWITNQAELLKEFQLLTDDYLSRYEPGLNLLESLEKTNTKESLVLLAKTEGEKELTKCNIDISNSESFAKIKSRDYLGLENCLAESNDRDIYLELFRVLPAETKIIHSQYIRQNELE